MGINNDVTSLLAMYERALVDCGALVAHCHSGDLGTATPCAGWDLATLVSHMIGQNEGFAVAVQTGDAAPSAYEGPPVTPASAHPDWSGSATRVLEAFRSAPVDRRVHIAGFGTYGVTTALRMQTLDTVVHSWDAATALGLRYRPDGDLVEFTAAYAADIAAVSPQGRPGVFSAPLVPTGTDAWIDALRLLGRDA